jgi:hypothetical protein
MVEAKPAQPVLRVDLDVVVDLDDDRHILLRIRARPYA